MINIIRSILNINKKLYIVVDTSVSKGKIARVCCTIGQKNPHMRFSSVIVVKCTHIEQYLYVVSKHNKNSYIVAGMFNEVKKRIKISGKYIDAGRTQCEEGTLLAFGVIVHRDDKLGLSLY